jgi:hypothetical protein
MNTTIGAGASTMTFDTAGQNAYWYSDISYPTGADDASIVTGNYTLNMNLNSLPAAPGSFPVVEATNTSATTSDNTNHTVSLPAGIQSGELLIAMLSGFDEAAALDISWPVGWTEFFEKDASSGMSLAVAGAYREADGTEGSSIAVTTDLAVLAAHTSYRISGAEDPATQPPEAATIEYTDTASGIDPPSLTPTGGAKDYLWLAVAGWRRTGVNETVNPGSYTDGIEVSSSGSSSGTRLRSLRRQANTSPEDPSTFTLGGNSERRVGATIAVHPAGSSVDITVSVHHTATNGSDPQLITSASATIDSNSTDPLVLDLGAGAEQTFTSADPRLLRIQITVDSIAGGQSFVLDYDSVADPSSLDTPVVTVPEWGMAFLLLVPLVPFLMSAIWRRKRLAGTLASIMLAISLLVGFLANDVPAHAEPNTIEEQLSYTTPITDPSDVSVAKPVYGPVNALGYRERVDLRSRSSTTQQLFVNGQPTDRYVFESSLAPLYYQDANGNWREIDTRWKQSSSLWDLEMVQAEYNAFAMRRFNGGELIKYLDPVSGQFVSFEPLPLQYTNNIGLVQTIADPQPVNSSVTENELYWTSAFGSGLDLKWIAGAGRLDKRLVVSDPSTLPPVSPIVSAGGDPALRLQFLFRHSPAVGVWVNGEPWREKSGGPVETSGIVEFRSRRDGRVLWSFNLPLSYDAQDDDDEPLIGTYRFHSSAEGLVVEHLVPIEILRQASYPLEIDVTIDNPISASADDATEQGDGPFTSTSTTIKCYSHTTTTHADYRACGMRWQNVTVPKDATIDAAYIRGYAVSSSHLNINHTFYFHDADDPANFVTNANILDTGQRPRTSASTNWTAALTLNAYNDSPSIVSVVQEIVNRTNWASGNAMVALGIPIGDVLDEARFESWDNAGSNNAILHIEYTAASPPAAPTNCQATYVSSVRIDVDWTDNANNETGFKVESSIDGGAYSQIGTTGANPTTPMYSDTSTSQNHSYQYRVRATNAEGDSTYCTPTSVIYTNPAAPSGATATHTADLEITVSWTDNSAYEDRFCIRRSKNGGTYGSCAYVVSGPYVDNTITQAEYDAGDSFTYRVRAEISTQGRVSSWSTSNQVVVPELVLLFAIMVPLVPLVVGGMRRRRRRARSRDSATLARATRDPLAHSHTSRQKDRSLASAVSRRSTE